MLTIYFKDGTERNFDNESGILIKETLINREIKSILTFNYEEDYFGDTTKREGVFFTDEMFGFCKESEGAKESEGPEPKQIQKVVVDVNGGEYIFDNLDGFRIARNSSKKAATVVDDATSDDFHELIGETCEFWFDGATKYTRMLVIGTDLSKENRTIFCFEEEQLYFLDKNNKQINF